MNNGIILHTALSVKNIEAFADFYIKYFGFKKEDLGKLQSDFFMSLKELYKLNTGIDAEHYFLIDESGNVIELFGFSQNTDRIEQIWNRPGYQHICIKVDSVPEKYKEMKANGVEFLMEPAFLSRPEDKKYWTFFKDIEGNLVELQD